MLERLAELLDLISGETTEIRNDWSDPRYNCRAIQAAIQEARTLIAETQHAETD